MGGVAVAHEGKGGGKKEAEKPASVETVDVDISIARSGSGAHVKKALSSLGFITDLKENGDTVTASVVETRDIHKDPYLYYEFAFKPSGVKVRYTVTPEVNASRRRIDICRNLLAMLALMDGSYGAAGMGSLYSIIQKALDDASANVTQSNQQLMNRHETLKRENADLVNRHTKLKEEYDELNNAFLELEKRSALLGERVKQLEGMTDTELKEELQRWIFEHDGSIKYSDFAKTFNIPQSRVEEGVNMLLKEGYIVRSD